MFDDEQAPLHQRLAELAEIALDVSERACVLIGERLGRSADGPDPLDRLEHPAGGRVQTVIEPRLEVEHHGLTGKGPVYDSVGYSSLRPEQVGSLVGTVHALISSSTVVPYRHGFLTEDRVRNVLAADTTLL
jgi:hypothetical protein